MNVKGLLIGAALVLAGTNVGYGISSKAECKVAQKYAQSAKVNNQRGGKNMKRADCNFSQGNKQAYKHNRQSQNNACYKGKGQYGNKQYARTKGPRMYSAENLDRIGATDAQKKQITAIVDAHKKEAAEQRKLMAEKRQKTHEAVMNVLTDEQKAKIAECKNRPQYKKDSTQRPQHAKRAKDATPNKYKK